jgi:hypothetical protein
MNALCGLTVMDRSDGAGTVTVVEPLIPRAVAVRVAVPCAVVVR